MFDYSKRTYDIANEMVARQLKDRTIFWEALDFSDANSTNHYDFPRNDAQWQINKTCEDDFIKSVSDAVVADDYDALGKLLGKQIKDYVVKISLFKADCKAEHEQAFNDYYDFNDYERGEWDAVHGFPAETTENVHYQNGYNLTYAQQQNADAKTEVQS